MAFQFGGTMNFDANSITTPGAYRISGAAVNTNGNTNGILLHFEPFDDHIIRMQIIMDFNGGGRCIRVYWYGTWNEWAAI